MTRAAGSRRCVHSLQHVDMIHEYILHCSEIVEGDLCVWIVVPQIAVCKRNGGEATLYLVCPESKLFSGRIVVWRMIDSKGQHMLVKRVVCGVKIMLVISRALSTRVRSRKGAAAITDNHGTRSKAGVMHRMAVDQGRKQSRQQHST
jgi:hypothetical protein